MSAERAIYEILSTDGGVSQLVGKRIYPITIDQGAGLPAIAYQQISGPREHNVSGAIGWVQSRYQITVWAATYIEAVDLATAVRLAVDGLSGTKASLVIDHIFVVDEGDVSDLFAENTELNIYGKRIDAQIVFKE
ncbi:MAG TPA: DUF3168 domain-containing protein [Marinobacter sp.]|uniref:DUF3168 domain-containing protein n=1 Tax=marine sediment metagenome TaxID=412755 RepID=A0A0F9SVW5_9ZZZZ|nr:DUF3168 domain-containing protein [Marinobacter sp.]